CSTKLFKQHVAESRIRRADVYGVHQFLYVVIHGYMSPPIQNIVTVSILDEPNNTSQNLLDCIHRYAIAWNSSRATEYRQQMPGCEPLLQHNKILPLQCSFQGINEGVIDLRFGDIGS